MKLFFTLLLLLNLNVSFSQWTRVVQLPASDIFCVYNKGNTLFAGGKNIIYTSLDKGQTWDSTSFIPQLRAVDNIIVFRNEIYASSFGRGIFKSPDNGLSWQNIGAGIAPFVSDFVEWKDNLYAATLGNSIFKLNPVTQNSWTSFGNGLSDFSVNVTSIAGTSNTLIAGTLANGIYDYLAPGSQNWEERLLTGQISPNESADDIITAHDSLFIAGRTGRFYLSTDNGLSWSKFGNSQALISNFTVNTRQAFLVARNFVDIGLRTIFFYLKKDSLDKQFVPFDLVSDHYTYGLRILDNKLWDASTRGLFYRSLSDLPGITQADDSVVLILLPVRFISFNVQLNAGKTVGIDWTTADESNIDHYEVERSDDRQHWTSLANIVPQSSNQYHSTDVLPLNGINYYRIKAVGSDGRLSYTLVKSVTLATEAVFRAWPNPVTDMLNIRINTNAESTAVIKLFDTKGGLIKQMNVAVLPGDNFFKLNTRSLSSGMYSLRAEWNNGQDNKTIQLLK
ncbi:MAG TPA: T9SS type A sorting domain-containing protein [Chitinophagaceae bacterium]|nr:T9SS type A sorting domain-containing protein [Chitinophagaceae bacterium]